MIKLDNLLKIKVFRVGYMLTPQNKKHKEIPKAGYKLKQIKGTNYEFTKQ